MCFAEYRELKKTIANDCYWNNKEIENDDTANQKLMKYICSLGYNCMLCSRVSWERKLTIIASGTSRRQDSLFVDSLSKEIIERGINMTNMMSDDEILSAINEYPDPKYI